MRFILILTILVSSIACFSQSIKQDTSFVALADAHEFKLYSDYIDGQSRLYNGTEYRDYLSRDQEHPYFGVDDWQPGSIVYDDEAFNNIELFYDISRDQVIIEHKLSGGKIETVAGKISQFTISKHPFVRLKQDSQRVIKEGFYEVLYKGNIDVYARREKQAQEKAENYTIVHSFTEKNRVYIFKDGIYHPVRSKKSVLAVLADKKQELRSLLKDSKLKYKANRELAIAKMAAEYDKQTN